MAAPNFQIIKGIIDSYFNIRKEKWNLNDKEPVQLVTSERTKYKINAGLNLLIKLEKQNSFDDWIDGIYFCAQQERLEDERMNRLQKLFIGKSILSRTFHAVLTYMISQLIEDEKFDQLKINLEIQKLGLEKSIQDDEKSQVSYDVIAETKKKLNEVTNKITALNHSKDHPESYFKDVILKYDPQAIALQENSFADFKQNVLNGQRNLKLCSKLLGYVMINHANDNDVSDNANQPKAAKHNKESSVLMAHSTFTNEPKKKVKEPEQQRRHHYNTRRH